MLQFVFRRLLQAIPILLAVAGLIFLLFSVIPGNFASTQISDGRAVMDAEAVERMNRQFGLDQPLATRFATYVGKLATLDLGTSFRTRQPVWHLIGERLWPTMQRAAIFASCCPVDLETNGTVLEARGLTSSTKISG